MQQFVLACTLTAIVTVFVSAFTPAIGTYQQYGIPADTPALTASGYLVQVDEIPAVRSGALRVLNFETLTGIITFPSFHSAAAVLALWALWGVWWMRPFALIAYGGMLLATPLVGGTLLRRRICRLCRGDRRHHRREIDGRAGARRIPAIAHSAATA